MVMSEECGENVLECEQVLDRIRYIGDRPAVADYATFARIVRIPRLIICSSFYDAIKEGQTASTLTPVWDNVAAGIIWIGWVNPVVDIMNPSAGYTFRVSDPRVRTWREDPEEQDVVEAAELYDAKAVTADAGYCLTGAYT
jgi:hypothetical protein